jgi:hypothetical protein
MNHPSTDDLTPNERAALRGLIRKSAAVPLNTQETIQARELLESVGEFEDKDLELVRKMLNRERALQVLSKFFGGITGGMKSFSGWLLAVVAAFTVLNDQASALLQWLIDRIQNGGNG